MPEPAGAGVTLRYAYADDHEALVRLAALDSAAPPPAPLLLAEVDGELRAALSLADGTSIADPFHPTVALVSLLQARAGQLAADGGTPRWVWHGRQWWRWYWPAGQYHR